MNFFKVQDFTNSFDYQLSTATRKNSGDISLATRRQPVRIQGWQPVRIKGEKLVINSDIVAKFLGAGGWG